MIYQFQSEQWVPASIDRVFQFFANPENLPKIAPSEQDVKIEELHLVPPPRHPLRARVTGVAGIGSEFTLSFRVGARRRTRWHTRIVDFEWNRYFIDTEISGPMEFWTHLHTFEASERDGREGTLVRDEIEYGPRYGVFGMVGEASFVRRNLPSTFEYRKEAVEKLLPPILKTDLPPSIAAQLQKLGEQMRRLKK